MVGLGLTPGDVILKEQTLLVQYWRSCSVLWISVKYANGDEICMQGRKWEIDWLSCARGGVSTDEPACGICPVELTRLVVMTVNSIDGIEHNRQMSHFLITLSLSLSLSFSFRSSCCFNYFSLYRSHSTSSHRFSQIRNNGLTFVFESTCECAKKAF